MTSTHDMEQQVLGTVLADPDAIAGKVAGLINRAPDSFENLDHGQIAAGIRDMHRAGDAVNFETVRKSLEKNWRSRTPLDDLFPALINQASNAGTAEFLAEDLIREYLRRHTLGSIEEAKLQLVESPDKACTVLDQLGKSLEFIRSIGEEHKREAYHPRSIGELQVRVDDDPSELIRHRFLCRGSSLLIAAPTGIGKSVIAMQMGIRWAAGQDCLGLTPRQPIRSLLIQAENDDGDLAEMRNGIVHGLALRDEEKERAFENFQFVMVDDRCGSQFAPCVLEPLCAEVKPDLVWIDPLLAYLGGAVGSQEVVSPWLRNQINPVIRRHNCGMVIVHHTNKPSSGQEKANWQAGDYAYLGTGSNDLANWPRAIIAIRSIGSHDVYEMHLGKRGRRAGWKDQDGLPVYSKFIAHGQDGIYWREADPEDLPQKPGPKARHTVDDLLECLECEMTTTELKNVADREAGIKERKFYELLKQAKDGNKITKSKMTGKLLKTP